MQIKSWAATLIVVTQVLAFGVTAVFVDNRDDVELHQLQSAIAEVSRQDTTRQMYIEQPSANDIIDIEDIESMTECMVEVQKNHDTDDSIFYVNAGSFTPFSATIEYAAIINTDNNEPRGMIYQCTLIFANNEVRVKSIPAELEYVRSRVREMR
ncbi:MAG: hypothetical protein AAGI89_14795 [Pseudomonadota bacterium]